MLRLSKFITVALLLIPILASTQISSVELEVRSLLEPQQRDTVIENWNRQFPSYAELTPEAQELLYWTNYSRINPRRFWDSVVLPALRTWPILVGSESRSLEVDLKRSQPLPLFSLNSLLLASAQKHCDDIAINNGEIGHFSTDKTSFPQRMKELGIRNCANENISLGGQSVLVSLVLLYLDIRLPEKGHRKVLLDPNLTEIGVGYAMYNKDQFFMVQDMACRQ